MMTNKQHDDLWMSAFGAIPGAANSLVSVAMSLRRANAITILKEMRAIGVISNDEYAEDLRQLLKNEGFQLD